MNLPQLPEGFNPFMTNVVISIDSYIPKKKKHLKSKEKDKDKEKHKKDKDKGPKQFFDQIEWAESDLQDPKRQKMGAPLPVPKTSNIAETPEETGAPDLINHQAGRGKKFMKLG